MNEQEQPSHTPPQHAGDQPLDMTQRADDNWLHVVARQQPPSKMRRRIKELMRGRPTIKRILGR